MDKLHPALIDATRSAYNEIKSLEEDKLALIEALTTLLKWSTGSKRAGNPYCHTEVEFALKALARAKGWSLERIGRDWRDAHK